ncbi:MAG: UDP-N-acetylmuramate--L-alanine ligase [Christensenellales bacterium]|jgi:UDP-N-acetylmuramate--alanine ligase
MEQVKLADYKGQRVHMVGIGGSSMSGLAQMLAHEGFTVSGSDSVDSYTLAILKDMGLDVRAGHHPHMVAGAGLLAYSAAIAEEDPERVEAARLGIPQMERAVLLGQIMETSRYQICVCGTHGKTTTSAMIAQVFTDLGADPSVHLGGSLDAIGGSVRVGKSSLFIAEACEFNRSFLHMPVTLAALLNIEEDHLDCYGDMAHVEAAYLQFLERLPKDGTLIALGSDPRVRRVVSRLKPMRRKIITFGEDAGFEYSFGDLRYDSLGNAHFKLLCAGRSLCQAALRVPGKYNALHALCALAVAHEQGLPVQAAADSLARFTGAHRRFEHTGTVQGMELYHDYGHNPAEMRVAVAMAKLQGRRVIAVMQPHTFTRVKTLFEDYLTCTQEADITLVTDIFAAREKDPGDISTPMLVEGMRRHGIQAYHTPGFDDTETWLLQNGQPGDLVLTMGCGNINLLNDQMNAHARQAKTNA